MERVCGCAVGRGESGVWMRVADIDMTRPKESCRSGFRKITSSGKTMCGGQSISCISTTFTSHRVPYVEESLATSMDTQIHFQHIIMITVYQSTHTFSME